MRAAPVVAILGPRQCGKTTLARDYFRQVSGVTYFDLEDPLDEARLGQPQLVLSDLRGLVVIDEIQQRPELFQLLRVLADRENAPAGAEVDLFFMRGGKRYGFESKYADAPRSTRSMHIALQDLSMERLLVIYPGGTDYPLAEQIEVVGLTSVGRLREWAL